MKRYGKLCAPAATARLPRNSKRGPSSRQIEAIYYRFTPLVVPENHAADVLLEFKVEGAPTAVKLKPESASTEVSLKDDGSGGDKVAGDGIYTVQLKSADILHNFMPDEVNRHFVGYLRLYLGSEQKGQYNVFVDVLTADIPSVPIKTVSSELQYTEHLVNIVDLTDIFTCEDGGVYLVHRR